MSVWYAIGAYSVFMAYLVAILFFERIVYIPFVGRHIKGLWNIAGLLFFVGVGLSVAVALTS